MCVSFGRVAARYGNEVRFLPAVQLSLLSRSGTFVERALQSLLGRIVSELWLPCTG